ncbi:MAG: ECF RNA polymerase sigma factor SigE [Firmicutes bacterium ADurb.Bin193]|nr:MAG: ECF RNA polymerase sigma factor SigE [Firmicutes bacterium ADurb.Bin193]
MDDRILVSEAKKGNISSFEKLVEQYQTKAFNLAYRILGNSEDAADAVQDALIKVYKNLGSFRESSKFSTWLYRITYNTCLDYLRKNKRIAASALDPSSPDNGPTLQEAAEKNERTEKIQRAVASLSPEYRVAVVLRDINGHSYEEAALILGCSIGTVKSRINRGRQKLKELLSDYLEQNQDTDRQNQ